MRSWCVLIFLEESSIKGLWASRAPAQIHLRLGSIFGPCPHLLNRLAPQATSDNVNTTQQLASAAAVLPSPPSASRGGRMLRRGAGEESELRSFPPPPVSLLGDRRGHPRTRLPFSGKQVAQTKIQRTRRALMFTKTSERKPAHR